jgi:hypothetical protein
LLLGLAASKEGNIDNILQYIAERLLHISACNCIGKEIY